MRQKGFGKTFRHLAALTMSVILLATGTSGGSNPAVVNAATLSHVKATEADVVNGDYYNSKGVQGTDFADAGDSVANLNLNHLMLNVDLADIIDTTGTGTPYEYNGKTYYFNENEGSIMKAMLSEVKKYREEGITWTFCLVMNFEGHVKDPALNKLMYNPEPGKVYYALNSINEDAQEWISAVFHYMAEKFSYSDTFVQNWRVGNEVNVSHDYNYTGVAGSSLKQTLVGLATASYNLLYEALQAENPHARAYVSVTHDWNNSNEGKGVPTKDFLDAFADGVIDQNWNVDFHAYPPQMMEQVWTKASAQYLTHKESTKFICGPNLEVLTDYIKKNFGTNHRVILSEQSYDSTYGQAEQAAMIAETYYAGVYNDMVDAVIFTTYKDTDSEYHDYYKMGIVDGNGNQKESYNVFRFMNTSQAVSYVDPYLSRLSSWTGRTISSWTDDILYQAPPTSAALTFAQLYHPTADIYLANGRDPDKMVWMSVLTNFTNSTDVDLVFHWTAYNNTTGETLVIGDDILGNDGIEWYPEENATYRITCTVRVAGNPSSQMSDSMDITVNMPGLPSSQPPAVEIPVGQFASYEGYNFYGDEDGNITCYGSNGEQVINDFKCDGTYTYYFQANGTAMKDRLTYHPDGVHVIYFDPNGHEVFDNFAYVGHNIPSMETGNATELNEYCYFNTFGYQYTDVVTWGANGTNREGKLFYANTGGILERNGWFTFSDTVQYAGDGTLWPGAGGRGYANETDCSLMRETWTYDENGLYRYINGYGVLE